MTLHWTIISNELTQIFFFSNRSPPQLIWIKQCLNLPYRNTVQEAQTFVKMADICCYGKCEWGVSIVIHLMKGEWMEDTDAGHNSIFVYCQQYIF